MFAQAPPAPAEPGTDATATSPRTTKPNDVDGMVKNQDFVIWSLVFAGVLLLAAVVFMFFDRWRKRPSGESTRDESLSLSSFKEMYENGELTEAEYEKIKAKWAAKLKATAGVPAAPPPTAVPPIDPTSPPPEVPPPA